MKVITLCSLLMVGSGACGETTLETIFGVSVTSYQSSPERARSREGLLNDLTAEQAGSPTPLLGYQLKWKIAVAESRIRPSASKDAELTLKIWDPVFKTYPGWNPPIVEIFSGEKRISCQTLDEVGMVLDVWADSQKDFCLSILTKERHRFASSTNVYRLDPDTMTLVHQGRFFSKEELQRESDEWKAIRVKEEQQQSKQTGTGQPTSRPDLESESADKPQPEAEERSR